MKVIRTLVNDRIAALPDNEVLDKHNDYDRIIYRTVSNLLESGQVMAESSLFLQDSLSGREKPLQPWEMIFTLILFFEHHSTSRTYERDN